MLQDNANVIAEAIAKDLGRCHFESIFTEIILSTNSAIEAYKNVHKWSKDRHPSAGIVWAFHRPTVRQEPKGTVLVLGGKSPVLIHESANLRTAAHRILWAKTTNCGQTCIAPDYVLCTRRVQDRFIEELKKAREEFWPNGTKLSGLSPNRQRQTIQSTGKYHRKYTGLGCHWGKMGRRGTTFSLLL